VREIRLREFQQSEPVELSVTQRDALAELVPSLNIRPVKGSSGAFSLTPQSTVGAAVVEGLAVVLEPKIPIDRVLFLISYCLDPKNWKHSAFQFDAADSLVEAIGISFASLLERALHRGLLQGYRPEEDSLSTVRGRIRFDEQLRRRNGSAPPVEVVFDEFTEDITENRILKAALNRLRHLRFRSEFAQRRLRRFDQTRYRMYSTRGSMSTTVQRSN
jgi:5-methylcytosine-specific restriction enzyme subunit McrC